MDRETPETLLEHRDSLSLPARLEAILYLKGRALTLGELLDVLALPGFVAERDGGGGDRSDALQQVHGELHLEDVEHSW